MFALRGSPSDTPATDRRGSLSPFSQIGKGLPKSKLFGDLCEGCFRGSNQSRGRYIGDYVGGLTEKLSFKSKKTRVKPEQEWTIIENHHEPIIDKELFEKVQKIY